MLPASFRQIAAASSLLDVTVAILAQGTEQALALPAGWQIAAAFCCLLPCSALRLPLAGARCHRSHFSSRYRSGLWLCCRPLFGKLLLLFVVCFLAAHWGYLLLELDVTVAILAQGTDQSLALLPASFRQIAAAFCCLLPCSALGLPLAGARLTVAFWLKVQIRPWLYCRPLFGKVLLFVVFFLAAH